ncbi:MAG: transglycosylase domain-containing protein [Hyphomicrobiaceae bacterium]
MLAILRLITRLLELLVAVPATILRWITIGSAFTLGVGPIRRAFGSAVSLFTAALLFYLVAAIALVYVVAPLRGFVGSAFLGEKLRYDAERWLATAIYDSNGNFVGTFDPRLDSQRDVNFTDEAIKIAGYTANPDHKSIPVRHVPELYWQCLKYHEDRNIGGWLNPFGIDLIGVLKIPYSTIRRSLAQRRIAFGVGGSTLPMQIARVIYKTPPSVRESLSEKIGRKLSEWWLAPVIYFELTRAGDDTPLRQWAANHLWLAQRTGGSPLHGIEVTSRIVFGKEAKDLTPAEQLVLASAVNKPIILLEGSKNLNAVRMDRWRYVLEVRARQCAEALIDADKAKKDVVFELISLAGGPPNPIVRPGLQAALERHVPRRAKRASANPRIRANVLLPSARFGVREEMKQAFGYNWRKAVRGITTTLNPYTNLALRRALQRELRNLDRRWRDQLLPGYTLKVQDALPGENAMPHVIVAASDHTGKIVRYFDTSQLAPYFGSIGARGKKDGRYNAGSENRQIASVGKMVAAIAITNEFTDTPTSLYLDDRAPSSGLEACRRNGSLRRGRKAIVAFACSLNRPLEWRTARIQPEKLTRIIEQLGFAMPPATTDGLATPPSTALVRGLIAGSPRRVHHMASVVLAALTGDANATVRPPTLIQSFDFTSQDAARAYAQKPPTTLRPVEIIRSPAHADLKTLLQAPLCYRSGRTSHGTLKSLRDWCAARRDGLKLHFAKTGTAVTSDSNATIDTWIAGGLQFDNGAKYSYVITVGTGSAAEPFARRLHANQLAAPLLRHLLRELEIDAHSGSGRRSQRKTSSRLATRRSGL